MYYIYVLRCEDNSLYTGIATDWKKRFEEHRTCGPKCAKYTRSHKVISVETLWKTLEKSNALKAERFFKTFSKQAKEEFVKYPDKFVEVFNIKYDNAIIETEKMD